MLKGEKRFFGEHVLQFFPITNLPIMVFYWLDRRKKATDRNRHIGQIQHDTHTTDIQKQK